MDKAKLLDQIGLPEDEVELEGIGTVRVRALSRYEILLANKGVADDDVVTMEQNMLAMAMLDPQMTKADIGKWQKISPIGQMQAVVAKVNELSGVGEGVQKEAYKSIREDAQPGV